MTNPEQTNKQMKSVSLSGSVRQSVGKKDAKAIRNAGNVPCILYGAGHQISFQVSYKELTPLVYTPDVTKVSLQIDGKTFTSIIKEIQFHPVTDKMIHVDFLELVDNKPIFMSVPVTVYGNSLGVKQGGKLVINARKLNIKATPENLPDSIKIDVEKLDIGQGIKVGALSLENVQILDEPNKMVVSVKTTRAAQAAATNAAETGKKK
jgi:large subunit ribosomal protein L25